MVVVVADSWFGEDDFCSSSCLSFMGIPEEFY